MTGTSLFGRKRTLTGVLAGIFNDGRLLNERKPEVEMYTDRERDMEYSVLIDD